MKLKNGFYSVKSDVVSMDAEFLSEIKKSGVTHKVINSEGPTCYTMVEFTGTKEQLCSILEFLNPSGYTKDELVDLLEDWDGDEDELWDII